MKNGGGRDWIITEKEQAEVGETERREKEREIYNSCINLRAINYIKYLL